MDQTIQLILLQQRHQQQQPQPETGQHLQKRGGLCSRLGNNCSKLQLPSSQQQQQELKLKLDNDGNDADTNYKNRKNRTLKSDDVDEDNNKLIQNIANVASNKNGEDSPPDCHHLPQHSLKLKFNRPIIIPITKKQEVQQNRKAAATNRQTNKIVLNKYKLIRQSNIYPEKIYYPKNHHQQNLINSLDDGDSCCTTDNVAHLQRGAPIHLINHKTPTVADDNNITMPPNPAAGKRHINYIVNDPNYYRKTNKVWYEKKTK